MFNVVGNNLEFPFLRNLGGDGTCGEHMAGARFTIPNAALLSESPFTDHAPRGPESLFADAQVGTIVTILRDVGGRALPIEATA